MDKVYIVSSGVTSTGNLISTRDEMIVQPGGSAVRTTVTDGGIMNVSSCGMAISANVSGSFAWGSMFVFSGGTADYTTIDRFGSMGINGGGTANNNTIKEGALRECGSSDFLHTAGDLDTAEEEAPALKKRTFADLRDAVGNHVMPIHQVRQQFWELSASEETVETRVVRSDRTGIDDGRPGLDVADMHEIANSVHKKAQDGKRDQQGWIQNRKPHTAFPRLRTELFVGFGNMVRLFAHGLFPVSD